MDTPPSVSIPQRGFWPGGTGHESIIADTRDRRERLLERDSRKTLRPAMSTDRSPRAPGHVLSAADVTADRRERFQEREYEKADMADRRQRFQERLKAGPTGGA